MVLGLVLAAIELATPGGFFVIFFGVAAVVVGILDVAGVAPQAWQQWLLFSIIAIVSLRIFRKPLLDKMRLTDPQVPVDSLVGEVAVTSTGIAPGEHGRAELRGSTWAVRNIDTTPLAAGQRCRVAAVQGLMLDVRPE
jgi:inner membrane protein